MSKSISTDVSVVICVHTERRWQNILDAVGSCESQTLPPTAIIVVVDYNRQLYEALKGGLVDITVIENMFSRGLCGGRNTGIHVSTTRFVAFLDDDATADAQWLENLVACFETPGVVAAGGMSRPSWASRRPRWMPEEFLWTLGCSYHGMPTARAEVRSLFGGCMCVRRALFHEIGGFDERLGRGSGWSIPVGGEEAEFFMRARRASQGSLFIYDPSATILHKIPASRTGFAYFIKRCLAEGICKAALSRLSSDEYRLASELKYTLNVLPAGVLRGLLGGMRGSAADTLKALAILAGLATTSAAYLFGRIAPLVHHAALGRRRGPAGEKPSFTPRKFFRHRTKFDAA